MRVNKRNTWVLGANKSNSMTITIFYCLIDVTSCQITNEYYYSLNINKKYANRVCYRRPNAIITIGKVNK